VQSDVTRDEVFNGNRDRVVAALRQFAREYDRALVPSPDTTPPDEPPRLNLGDLVMRTWEHYHLNSELTTVDYWAFLVATSDITDPDPRTRATAGHRHRAVGSRGHR
jgi:hypothetical protein